MSTHENIVLEENAWALFEDFFDSCRKYPKNINLFMKAQGVTDKRDIRINTAFDNLLKWDYEFCLKDPVECLKMYCSKSSHTLD